MPIDVVCFCGYFCNQSLSWRSEDFDSFKWVQALKGRSLNKHAYVPVRGVRRRLSNENADDATTWFGQFAADYLKRKKTCGPFLVVPLPNSDCVTNSNSRPRTRRLAKAICDSLNDGSVVLDCLRFKKDLGSASKDGGPRAAEVIYGNLVALKDTLGVARDNFTVLLVDDVTTSGGHLKACVARLESIGLVVHTVMCGGKTVYDQDHKAFHVYEYTLDEYEP
jgi:hypothetical protein